MDMPTCAKDAVDRNSNPAANKSGIMMRMRMGSPLSKSSVLISMAVQRCRVFPSVTAPTGILFFEGGYRPQSAVVVAFRKGPTFATAGMLTCVWSAALLRRRTSAGREETAARLP